MMNSTRLADTIHRFIDDMGQWIRSRNLTAMQDDIDCQKIRMAPDDSELAGRLGEQMVARQWHDTGRRRDAVAAGHNLARELARHQHDPAGLLEFLHCLDGGGGPEQTAERWLSIKGKLQAIALQAEGEGTEGSAEQRVLKALTADYHRDWKSDELAQAAGIEHGSTVRQTEAWKHWRRERQEQQRAGRGKRGQKTEGQIEVVDGNNWQAEIDDRLDAEL